jgi:hypothetical protein
MNQPNATESALRDGSRREFRPLIWIKAGVAARWNWLGSLPGLPNGLPELGSCQDVTRAASKHGRGG